VDPRAIFRLAILASTAVVLGLLWIRLRPEGAPAHHLPDPSDFLEPGTLGGRALDEAAAAKLFPANRKGPKYAYDPLAHSVLVPGFHARQVWAEHPDGGYEERTNNLGFREDEPTATAKRDLRVLVLGDSHTEGVAANAETYPNVLERRLARAFPGRDVEVLNLGVGGTGPWSFRGMLERWKGLAPDLVIATLFTGNDFWDALSLADFLSKRRFPRATEEYKKRIRTAAQRYPVSQGVNQAYRFRHFPEERDLALAEAVRAYEAMDARCRELGIAFLAVVLPTKADVDGDDGRVRHQKVLAYLGLTQDDYEANARLAEAFVAAMEARGIAVVDATPSMRSATRPFFWREDLHLSVAGHAHLAELLLAPVAAALGLAADADEGITPR